MTVGEMMPGWARASLGDVVESMKNGLYKPADAYADDGVVCLRMYNIDNGRLVLRDLKRMRLSDDEIRDYGLLPDDLLVNRVNSRELVGKTAAIPSSLGPAVFESKNIRLRLHSDAANAHFISHQLSLRGTAYFSGNAQQVVGMASISQTQIARFPIVLAPRDEQDRIAAKLDELFSDLDAGVAALERARANLKRYRAAVLKAAVEGRLTEQWRKEHPDVESASKLLERILVERRSKWEADQIAKFTAAGKIPPRGWKDKYPEPTKPNDSNGSGLPEGWCWATMEQIGEVQLGRQRSPKNRSKDYPTKYLRAANITEMGLDLSDVLDMEFKPNEKQNYLLREGDIILSEASGSPNQVGKPAIWREELDECCFQNTVIRLRPAVVDLSAYLLNVLRAYYINGVFAKTATGVGINHLSAYKFARLSLPLAPLMEQTEVVSQIEAVFSTIANSELGIELSRERATRLRQSILKRAFEGKLVPQDPNDEPASVLLERIRKARENATPPSRGRRKSRA